MQQKRALLVLLCAAAAASCALVNRQVTRTVDLTTQFAYHNVQVEVENTAGAAEAAAAYLVLVPAGQARSMSLARVSEMVPLPLEEPEEGEEAPQQRYSTEPLAATKSVAEDGTVTYEAALREPLAAGASVKLMVEFFFTHTMTAVPEAIPQGEHQTVVYEESHVWFTPYKSTSMVTYVKLPSTHVVSRTEKAPTSAVNETLIYGPYERVAAMSWDNMRVHFENDSPFITITNVERELEVSHWGSNLAVEEHYWVRHDGARLDGEFRRLEIQRAPQSLLSGVNSLHMVLPLSASGIYYRDEVGNVSTSEVFESDRGVELELVPRFPLFGGWKIAFYIGYNLPLSSYLFKDSETGARKLVAPFAPAVDSAVVDHITTRVILPEGCKFVSAESVLAKGPAALSRRKTYLDTVGRTVVELESGNLFNEHSKEQYQLTATYYASALAMLQEPLLLILGFFVVFVVCILVRRLDLSIAPAVEVPAAAKDAAKPKHPKRN
eukprot:TRINITY_DN17559_c0_g1_i1.p1 TRINITY_DN17559_c0_g1~~TRINITY_DN17559_c0_g1_i1.p1  ORF type:complete len:509 (-),score=153.54 TRINITY_DN17559_c0_g1_i1:61-1542(-)